MFRSIRSRLIVAVVIMAALLGVLIYLSSLRLGELKTTLNDLEAQQEYKSHVLQPQKDMNQFLAAMDKAVLLTELGEGDRAQEAYQESVDAEQDISGEFAFLEKNGTPELRALSEKAHIEWENATVFLKLHAEKAAAEQKATLLRPKTEPTKTVDAHSDAALRQVTDKYAAMTSAQMEAVLENDDTSPIEIADNLIDGLEDAADEVLAAEKAAGEKTLAGTSQTIMWSASGVLAAILGIGFAATISISRPLTELRTGAERIADGDLGYTFTKIPSDEVGDVIHSVQKMSGSLKDRIRNLEEVAGVVVLTGDEIETAARSLDADSPAVEEIVSKAGVLKDLVGQVLSPKK